MSQLVAQETYTNSSKGPSNTSIYADSDTTRTSNKPKKTVNRLRPFRIFNLGLQLNSSLDCLAQIIIYSMAIDEASVADNIQSSAGSHALAALDRIIMSTESFFHPSNSGPWTLTVRSIYLTLEFEYD
jgi:proteasome activator subunit 4